MVKVHCCQPGLQFYLQCIAEQGFSETTLPLHSAYLRQDFKVCNGDLVS